MRRSGPTKAETDERMRRQTAERHRIRTVGREGLMDAADGLDHPHTTIFSGPSPATHSHCERRWCFPVALCSSCPFVRRGQSLYGDYSPVPFVSGAGIARARLRIRPSVDRPRPSPP